MIGLNLSALAVALGLLFGPAAGHAEERWVEGELTAASGRTDGSLGFYEHTPFRHDFDGLGDYSLGVASLHSSASIRSTVDYGWVRTVGVASAWSGMVAAGVGGSGYGEYISQAAFSDTLTIDIPRLNGQQGTVTMGMFVDGLLSAGAESNNDPNMPCCGDAYGDVQANFRGPGPFGPLGRLAEFGVSVRSPGLPEGDPTFAFIDEQFVGGVATFTFGTPFDIIASIKLGGNAGAGLPDAPPPYSSYTATMVGDFGNTMTWAGLLDMRDADGNLVDDFSVTSLSGTDYRFAIAAPPVPEPATVLLFAAGLAGLRYATRRRPC